MNSIIKLSGSTFVWTASFVVHLQCNFSFCLLFAIHPLLVERKNYKTIYSKMTTKSDHEAIVSSSKEAQLPSVVVHRNKSNTKSSSKSMLITLISHFWKLLSMYSIEIYSHLESQNRQQNCSKETNKIKDYIQKQI